MFLHNNRPTEVAVALLSRSTCGVQVAAVIADNEGIYSWGTNHIGFDGLGCHAEPEALRRANRKRLAGSILYVCAQRRRNARVVTARPCEDCQEQLRNSRGLQVVFRDGEGTWRHFG